MGLSAFLVISSHIKIIIGKYIILFVASKLMLPEGWMREEVTEIRILYRAARDVGDGCGAPHNVVKGRKMITQRCERHFIISKLNMYIFINLIQSMFRNQSALSKIKPLNKAFKSKENLPTLVRNKQYRDRTDID